jgi:hypothetical protein
LHSALEKQLINSHYPFFQLFLKADSHFRLIAKADSYPGFLYIRTSTGNFETGFRNGGRTFRNRETGIGYIKSSI